MTYPGPPPAFGHQTRDAEFAFKPGFINLNCGSFGATPIKVTQYVRTLTEEIEQSPDYFHRLNYQARLIEVREKLAQYIGADTDEVVLVGNATSGVNAVLRNFAFEQGDTLVSFNTTYGSVDKTAQYLSDVSPYPRRKIIQLLFPTTVANIIKTFQDFVAANPSVPGKKTVVIIDAIVSNPGVKLPWEELVAICKERGFWSVIDAAHSLGQETNINLRAVQPDFWVSNCYKWMSAKRSVTVLYVPVRNRHIIQSSVPTSASYVSPPGDSFLAQFQYNGLIDYANYFSVLEALKFRVWVGGELKINDYCHKLAIDGGNLLRDKYNMELMDPDDEFTLSMVNVKLPNFDKGPSSAISRRFAEKLFENNAYSVPYYHNGSWWTRLSAQIWNDISDFDKIGEIWIKIIDEVNAEPPQRGIPVEDPALDPEHPY